MTDADIIKLVGIIIVFGLLYFAFKDANKKYQKLNLKKQQDYYVKLEKFQANCTIFCKFLYGIEQLVENTPCYLYANEKQLTIVTMESTPVIVNLNLSQIEKFKIFDRDTTIQRLVWLGAPILINKNASNEFIIIRYLSNNSETKELFFSLNLTTRQRVENNYYLDQCNIFDYVNARIPEQETTIDL